LDHYVEIREEFDRVEQRLRTVVGDDYFDSGFGMIDSLTNSEQADGSNKSGGVGGFLRWIRSRLVVKLVYPQLRAKYLELLVQVKFHQLRLHFVEEHKLPLHFKVSDYLKRSERSVLQHLVHVSPSAWLLLTGGLSLLYFGMGMVAFVSEDPFVVGRSMASIYFACMVIFVFISIAVHYKMKSIFRKIITMKSIDLYKAEEGVKQQLSFFWGSDPHLVIAIIQFMQFGYALALSIIIIYWKDMKGDLERWWYPVAVFTCYIMFVRVMAIVLPEYTLCTSLAHLYNKKHLQETLATYRLENARKKQKQIMAQRDIIMSRQQNESNSLVVVPLIGDDGASTGAVSNRSSSTNANSAMNMTAEVLSMSRATSFDSLTNLAGETDPSLDKQAMLAALVKSDTKLLRSVLPQESKRVLMTREQKRNQRRASRRSFSDGVAAMRAGMEVAETIQETTPTHHVAVNAAGDLVTAKPNSGRRQKSSSAGDLVKAWGEKASDRADLGTPDKSRVVDHVPDIGVTSGGVLTLVEEDEASVDALSDVAENDVNGEITDKRPENTGLYQTPMTCAQKLGNFFSWKTFSDTVRHLLMHKKYETASHVFGTIVVFFLISQRIESMLALTYVIDDSSNTWNMTIFVGFWWIFAMLSLFLLESFLTFILFSPGPSNDAAHGTKQSNNNYKHRRLVVAAAIDTVISGACMALLFLAEMQRCCNEEDNEHDYIDNLAHNLHYDGNYRMLAGKDKDKDGYYEESAGGFIDKHFESTNYDCCPRWGERTYGGLGMLEPFTGLIALRALRFSLARYLIGEPTKNSEGKSAHKEEITQRTEPHDALGDSSTETATAAHSSHDNHNQNDSMACERGTALELWEHAIGKYPEIVDKYGEFSAELFQAMLGLPVMEFLSANGTANRDHGQEIVHASSNTKDIGAPAEDVESGDDSQHICLSGKHYSNLPPDAQGIIIAGKLGKPVKSILSTTRVSFSNLPTLNVVPEHEEDDIRPLKEPIELSSQQRLDPASNLRLPPLEFVVDKELMALESSDTNTRMFIAPNAQLVRSMRRCDRRLLPLLNRWAAVDVVMTKYELVYFEASDSLESDAANNVLLAVKATKGGKGLRLCDVAMGRKVVGHLELSEITELHVERDTPLKDTASLDKRTEEYNRLHIDESDEDLLHAEYWIRPSDVATKSSQRTRNDRWAKANEDRLKLVSPHGTLILRFYSDLHSSEAEKQGDGNVLDCEHITKDVCLQWAQTIARVCGRSQLKQSLPHFGQNSEEELRDYLEVVHFHDKEEEEVQKRNRRSSLAMPPISLSERVAYDIKAEVSDEIQKPKPLSGMNRGESFP
jgi:hypothetical protein